jgi:hypothetical protein
VTTDFMAGLHRGEMAADHFTVVANSVARDRMLSYAAKGLFLNMASHRAGFTITEEFLARQSTDGVKTVRRLLVELREAGYVYRSPERTRFPAGTRNTAGKDISGALGPYTWLVTDKPDEIAVILAQYREETAGQHYLPIGPVVDGAQPVDNPDLAARRAGSADLGEQAISAGGDNRPVTTVLTGTSKEDHFKNSDPETDGRTSAAPTEERQHLAGRIVAGLDLRRCGPSQKQRAQITDAVAAALARGVAAPVVAEYARGKALEADTVKYLVKAFAEEHLPTGVVPVVPVSALSPVCGQCDARDGDPVSARVVWLDAERTQSTRCPRCHPRATGGAR